MKYYKLIIIILIVFLKTGNVLSNNNVFDVNNIEVKKKGKITNDKLVNQAVKTGFNQLIQKILLEEDIRKLKDLKFSKIKELVKYYKVSNRAKENINIKRISYNISFDKDKIHNLFYKRNISYSKILDKELFILPILKKNNQIFIYNQNFFYDKWNKIYNVDLIEFILPLENIEIIQNINKNRDNLLNLELSELFEEYTNKNLALVLIEEKNSNEEKVYFKVNILGKTIVKNIIVKKNNLDTEKFFEKIITEVKKEIINIVKAQNLIDISTPSFLNAQLDLSSKGNLMEFYLRLEKIQLVEKIIVHEFNNKSVFLKIKYLGKLDKIIKELKEQKIILKLEGDRWNIKII